MSVNRPQCRSLLISHKLTSSQILMSMEIFHFDTSAPGDIENFLLPNALYFYLAVSLPLLILTFIAWGVLFYTSQKASKRRIRQLRWAKSEEFFSVARFFCSVTYFVVLDDRVSDFGAGFLRDLERYHPSLKLLKKTR